MDNNSSYQIKNIASNLKQEISRLGGQVDLFWKNELKHYKEFGLKDGMSVVELGCGPGFLLGKLLDEFPAIHVTGVEIEDTLVEYAQIMLAEKGYDRFDIIEGSILDIDLPDDSFDFAITRLVVEHLKNPLKAVMEVKRILKPGGIAVFVDNDFELHIMTCPHVPELRMLYDAYCRCRYDEGGNPKMGRELPELLYAGGFVDIDFEVISAHSVLLGDEMFFRSEGINIPSKLVKDGYLTSKELAKILVGWKKMIDDKNHSIVRQLFAAAGRKPEI